MSEDTSSPTQDTFSPTPANLPLTLELMIDTVKGNPFLYDPRKPQYKCRDAKEEAWSAVGTVVGFSGDKARRHWKSLRDRYVKERVKPYSKWHYLKKMDFLAEFIISKNREPAEEECDGESLDQSETEVKFSPVEFKTDQQHGSFISPTESGQVSSTLIPPSSSSFDQSSVSRQDPHYQGSFNCQKINAGEPSLVSYVPEAVRNLRDEELYGLSVAYTLMRLSPRKRAMAKMKIQNALFEVEFRED